MKKVLIALGLIVVLLIGAVIALPSLVPADRIRQEVAAQVKAATGRDLIIDGKVSVSVIPSLSVQVSNVALSNPPGFLGKAKEMARLGALDVHLKLLPLLSGRIEVDNFVLVDPIVTLEVDRQGRANWVFDAKPADPAKPTEQAPAKSGGGFSDISLGQVRIENGKLTYLDDRTATREEIDTINLAMNLKNLDSPFTATGGLTWRGKAVTMDLAMAKPRALLEAAASPAQLSVKSDAVTLGFTGEAMAAAVTGELDLSVPSVRGLTQWTTGKLLDMAGSGLGPFSLKGRLAADGGKIALTQAVMGLDAITAKGDFNLRTDGVRPSLKGRLDVDSLDLNPYLPPRQPVASGTGVPATGPGGQSDWSDAPLDASGLKAADVDFALTAGSITIHEIKVGKSALNVVLTDGRLNAELSQLDLYQGVGKGRLGLDGSQPGLGLNAAFSLDGLAAEPFLKDAAGFDRLSGTGNADIQVSGRGKSQRALVSSLDGKGAVTFVDGAITGINLAEMVRNVGSAFTADGTSQKTDFAELSGTFTLANGVVANNDLALKSPLLRVEGAGTVELPPRTVHYRVEPKAVASLQGQGGKDDLGGVTVPVIIEGPWDKLSFRPDLEAMVKGRANEALKGAIGEKLPGLLGGEQKQSDPLPINPGRLFGR